jgi:hypothetical protein
MKTKEKLANMLKQHDAPIAMIEAARLGRYDDFESLSATPMMDLVRDCKQLNLNEIAEMAMNGEFDGTKEEAEEWYEREGRHLL